MNATTARRLGLACAVAAVVALMFAALAPAARAAVNRTEGRTVDHPAFQEGEAGGTATGCSGSAVSMNEDGEVIDGVSSGPPGTSRSNALTIDYDGVVSYDGRSDAIIKNHNWYIAIFGIKVKSDGDTNDEERQIDSGDEKVSDYIPLRMSGKYYVTFEISGEGGTCKGSLWVEIDEDPVGTLPWIAGTGFLVLGLAGLAFSIPSGAAVAGAGAAATIGAAGATPAETVIGSNAAAPGDGGQVIGDTDGDSGSSDAADGGDDDGPVIGA